MRITITEVACARPEKAGNSQGFKEKQRVIEDRQARKLVDNDRLAGSMAGLAWNKSC